MLIFFFDPLEASVRWPGNKESHSEVQKSVDWMFVCSVTEGCVTAVSGQDKDGFVREELHRSLHPALFCLHTTQSLNIQNIS